MNDGVVEIKALITGITGFVGSHMAEFLLGMKNMEVYGTYRWRSPFDNIEHIKDKVHLVNCELNDSKSTYIAITKSKPDVIFHLAAQSYVPVSFEEPSYTIETNVLGTLNILEAIRLIRETDKSYDPIIHICSSSEVYGQVKKDEVPITELNPLRPASPYAVSKVGEDYIALQYFLSYGLKIIRTRMFTHSVSKWTPVIIKDSSELIDVKYISEIRQKQKKGGYLSGKKLSDGTQIWDLSRNDLQVWNDNSWTKIKHISCHPINKHRLLEISSRSGVVDATDNHSIINEKGKEIEAGKIKIGSKVKITRMPKSEITFIRDGLAWLYGFFVAEGTVTGGKMKISNKDRKKLEKAKSCLLKYLAIHSSVHDERDMFVLQVHKPFNIAKRFYDECYASDKNKKIPKIILNGDKKTKLAFLRGYNDGDGDLNNKVKSEFYRFKTKSPILAAGICILSESVGLKPRLHVEHRDEKRYFEIRLLSQKNTKNGRWLLKDDNSVTKITQLTYTDEVWDFETETHWFCAGIGGNIVHNTGPRRGSVFAESAFAKQIAEIELGIKKDSTVYVGNLDSVRTFADVRDAVKAYWMLTQKCTPGEVYNIGGNRTMTVGEMLNYLISISTKKDEIKVKVRESLLRPSDVTLQIPSIEKFVKETGWKPEIPFETTMKDLLDYWRKTLSAKQKISASQQ